MENRSRERSGRSYTAAPPPFPRRFRGCPALPHSPFFLCAPEQEDTSPGTSSRVGSGGVTALRFTAPDPTRFGGGAKDWPGKAPVPKLEATPPPEQQPSTFCTPGTGSVERGVFFFPRTGRGCGFACCLHLACLRGPVSLQGMGIVADPCPRSTENSREESGVTPVPVTPALLGRDPGGEGSGAGSGGPLPTRWALPGKFPGMGNGRASQPARKLSRKGSERVLIGRSLLLSFPAPLSSPSDST